MLAHEGVSEREDTWALGSISVHKQVPDVRAGARCPEAHEEPDVRASSRMSGLNLAGFGCIM